MLNDITNGTNPGCGTAGISAARGWDPVTGLGTPELKVWRKSSCTDDTRNSKFPKDGRLLHELAIGCQVIRNIECFCGETQVSEGSAKKKKIASFLSRHKGFQGLLQILEKLETRNLSSPSTLNTSSDLVMISLDI
jgi:hypothetical protein